jgi:hypothetical protein
VDFSPVFALFERLPSKGGIDATVERAEMSPSEGALRGAASAGMVQESHVYAHTTLKGHGRAAKFDLSQGIREKMATRRGKAANGDILFLTQKSCPKYNQLSQGY